MRTPSPSTIIAGVALFAALGGTATAAVTLGRDSVSAKHIKRAAVSTSELRDRGIRLRDLHRTARPPSRARIAQIAEDTMTSQEVLDALSVAVRGEPGAPGADGAPGAQGPAGPQGPSGVVRSVVREELSALIGPGETGGAVARCQPGERVLGGGGRPEPAGAFALQATYPVADSEHGWTATYVNTSATQSGRVRAFAVCAPA